MSSVPLLPHEQSWFHMRVGLISTETLRISRIAATCVGWANSQTCRQKFPRRHSCRKLGCERGQSFLPRGRLRVGRQTLRLSPNLFPVLFCRDRDIPVASHG